MRQTGKKREMFIIIQLICATFPFLTHVSKTMLFMCVVFIFTKFLVVKMFVLYNYRITINNE